MKMRRIEFVAVLLLALGAAAGVRAQDNPCGKNHYILDTPSCDAKAVEFPIGAPSAITVNANGNVYFSVPNLIFRLDARGGLTRIAGSVKRGFAGDGGPATRALLNFPRFDWNGDCAVNEYEKASIIHGHEFYTALATDSEGALFIADTCNNRVRKIDSSGIISTAAGGDTSDGPEKGLPLASAPLHWPQDVAVDDGGTLYVSDLRVVPEDQNPTGWGPSVFRTQKVVTADRVLFDLAECADDSVRCRAHLITTTNDSGRITSPPYPCRVFDVETREIVSPLPFNCGETKGLSNGSSAPIGIGVDQWGDIYIGASDIAADANGNLYVSDGYSNCIRKIDSTGIVAIFAGQCLSYGYYSGSNYFGGGFSGDGGLATSAQLNGPHGVAVDSHGNVYIADTQNLRIRKVTPDGIITTVAGNGHALPLPQQ